MTLNNSKKNVYIALGSNIGDRLFLLKQAVQLIEKQIGKIILISNVYESQAQGYDSENNYLNAVAFCESTKEPEQIMEILLTIETELGRKRTSDSYEDRPIDLDFILLDTFENTINTSLLTLPHPRIFERNFVIIPLLEVVDEELKTKIKCYFTNNEIDEFKKQLTKHDVTL